jgi:hypothetical protein
MKLTRQQLTTIIKEELQAVLGEQEMTPEEAGLDPEEEKKLAPMCLDPDLAASANISADSLGYKGDFCLDMAYKKFEEKAGQPLTDPEKEVFDRVAKKLGSDGVFDFLSREKLVLIDTGELMGFNPMETYLTQQDLEAIFEMFNPPEHEREEDEDLGGVMTTFADQSNERVQMLIMLAKFTSKLKVSRASSVDEQIFHEEDFGGEVPENIVFYN